MNLGDGLKLETEILDGKTRLILAPSVGKSKSSVKMCNKNKILKHTLRTKQNGNILKSVQTTCEMNECLTKRRTGSRLSATKGGRNHEIIIPTKESRQKDHAFVIHTDSTPDICTTRVSVKNPSVYNKKSKKAPISVEDLRDSLVCLTQQQLEQILTAVKGGTKGISQLQDKKAEKTIQNSSDLNPPVDQVPEEENIMGLLQKAGETLSVPSENSLRNKDLLKHAEQKIIVNSWKPADIFSTLGERERDKPLLDAKKSQWKKELDEQVALKKKLQENLDSESKCHLWQKANAVKNCSEKGQMANQIQMPFSEDLSSTTDDILICRSSATEASEPSPSISSSQTGQFSNFSSPDLPAAIRSSFVLGEAAPVEHPFSAVKREQQKKWLEELDKQKEAAKLRKKEEKSDLSKAEEHDRWTMHFDSFRNHAYASSQYPLNATYKKSIETLQFSPEPQDSITFTPTALCHPTPTEVENSGKSVGSNISESSQKGSFLRSMTALLDPAQLEERERRRQKQLEHQKAIMAQVEEKRMKKQLEEEQRKREEQEEECRLAREQELMKKQFEDDLLRQKQKEEIMTLKTNELYQSMQRAQELAQRLKQEQRIKELAQKGHDISKLQKNLGSSDILNESIDLNGFSDVIKLHDHCSAENTRMVNQEVKTVLSPRKDTAVQTDNVNTNMYIGQTKSGRVNCMSPDISIEYKVDSNTKKSKKELQYTDKKNISEKENIVNYSNLNEPTIQKPKHTKPLESKSLESNEKKPDWNINKPCKRFVPASERYPRCLQKQREEKKARRQMELLLLVERNSPGNLCQKKSISPDPSPSPHHEDNVKNKMNPVRKEEPSSSENNLMEPSNDTKEKNIYKDHYQSERPAPSAEIERPPSAYFVPYVRTNEVYYLDPDAPMTRPSTHDPQYQQPNESYTPRQIFSSDHVRDPLFNPNVVRDRQQAILKGLSDLRQGLLQKQKELETCLIPSIISQEENFISPF
ncbi:coiled-coil domain-containing protein 66 isoform X2 [Sphaerodactylus townsendi]|uniref:coiled-coil domain-containing protein 66 isoform X2 n=1 Tax=Sphaerodactylus townsendi TaxID=933632 RepID=UPI0020275FA2|nr:coiled-coil domain-containing protein 66 isoform X2 [Sphaerodactylus townsendi]